MNAAERRAWREMWNPSRWPDIPAGGKGFDFRTGEIYIHDGKGNYVSTTDATIVQSEPNAMIVKLPEGKPLAGYYKQLAKEAAVLGEDGVELLNQWFLQQGCPIDEVDGLPQDMTFEVCEAVKLTLTAASKKPTSKPRAPRKKVKADNPVVGEILHDKDTNQAFVVNEFKYAEPDVANQAHLSFEEIAETATSIEAVEPENIPDRLVRVVEDPTPSTISLALQRLEELKDIANSIDIKFEDTLRPILNGRPRHDSAAIDEYEAWLTDRLGESMSADPSEATEMPEGLASDTESLANTAAAERMQAELTKSLVTTLGPFLMAPKPETVALDHLNEVAREIEAHGAVDYTPAEIRELGDARINVVDPTFAKVKEEVNTFLQSVIDQGAVAPIQLPESTRNTDTIEVTPEQTASLMVTEEGRTIDSITGEVLSEEDVISVMRLPAEQKFEVVDDESADYVVKIIEQLQHEAEVIITQATAKANQLLQYRQGILFRFGGQLKDYAAANLKKTKAGGYRTKNVKLPHGTIYFAVTGGTKVFDRNETKKWLEKMSPEELAMYPAQREMVFDIRKFYPLAMAGQQIPGVSVTSSDPLGKMTIGVGGGWTTGKLGKIVKTLKIEHDTTLIEDGIEDGEDAA